MSFADVETTLPELEICPTEISLFRFSSVTWNPHRIHYDKPYAATEGYPGVLVQGHLHGCWLISAVNRWLGEKGRIESFSWENRHFATTGDTLTVTGRVAAADGDLRTLELKTSNQDGVVCAPGRAVVRLTREEEVA
ncbi:acyl dehydratase [Nocardioides immobilis]|uniref:Acyl dehydratase n=1 Tax=Nocardioides immobilis TaxID=2049295 RepID=A0A417Y6N1_9ACTN|nr:MaoC/PaaZ C-terminal domain-containing protein [Nocardioides immobilis]RHW28382.1 acyl dehydratase [Nocardioides immobilis]